MTHAPIPEEAKRRLREQLTQWSLPEDLAEELAQHNTSVTYPKGATVFLQGSPSDLVFRVLSGLVEVYYPNPDGSRFVVNVAAPGDFTGYTEFIDSKGHRVYALQAEALTKCSLGVFTRGQMLRILQRLGPAKLVQLLENMNLSWSTAVAAYVKFFGLSFRERLETVLMDLATRLGVRDSNGVLLTPELSHDLLAEMICSSRPMVSRIISDMIDSGLISRQGKHYTLLDPSKLGPQAMFG
jgi:CRP/FNR family cyclic AMP-dependent transcriptional regulator